MTAKNDQWRDTLIRAAALNEELEALARAQRWEDFGPLQSERDRLLSTLRDVDFSRLAVADQAELAERINGIKRHNSALLALAEREKTALQRDRKASNHSERAVKAYRK